MSYIRTVHPIGQYLKSVFTEMAQQQDEFEDQFQLSAAEYLERSHVCTYLRDVVELLLVNRDERPLEFIHHYFQNVMGGDNIIGRNFVYINATPRNRLAFIAHSDSAFKAFPPDQLITSDDYHQLLRMLCPDFPQIPVSTAAYLLGPSGDPVKHSTQKQQSSPRFKFSTIALAVQILFYYTEFFVDASNCFSALAQKQIQDQKTEASTERSDRRHRSVPVMRGSAVHSISQLVRKNYADALSCIPGHIIGAAVDVCSEPSALAPSPNCLSYLQFCAVLLRSKAVGDRLRGWTGASAPSVAPTMAAASILRSPSNSSRMLKQQQQQQQQQQPSQPITSEIVSSKKKKVKKRQPHSLS